MQDELSRSESEWHWTKELEPIYPLKAAVVMIPMPTMSALYNFLQKHKEEFPDYKGRVEGGPKRKRGGVELRFLSLSEIKKIREMTIFGWEDSRYNRPDAAKRGPKPKIKIKANSPLAWIVQKATA